MLKDNSRIVDPHRLQTSDKNGREAIVMTSMTIEQIAEKIIPIAKNHGVKAIYLFGSYARNEATPESDIDLLIEPGKIQTFTQLSRFAQDAENATSKKIDILTFSQVDDNLQLNIDKSQILLFEN